MTAPTELFLSHASQDQRFASRLAKTLERHGILVWYSKTSLIGSQRWQDEIGEALQRCDWFLVVLSPNALESMWVRRETQYALRQRRLDKRIVPALYRPCDLEKLSWVLPDFQIVNFHRKFETGCRELLRIWDLEWEAADSSS